jgi:hypothetical protein
LCIHTFTNGESHAAQVCELLARQLPVRLELRHGVVHVAIGGCVRIALVHEGLHHRDDLRDELRRPRLVVAETHT